jgi:peptidyl-prolyl cis-trans isomerase C
MKRTSPPPSMPILSLSLAFLLTGVACSRGSAEQAGSAKAPAGQGQAQAAATAPAPAPTPTAPPATGAAPSGAAAATPAAPGAPAAATGLSPDKIPAVVAKCNGTDIRKDQLLKDAHQIQGAMQGSPANLDASFYHQVLDSIIARTLLEQDAKAQGVTVADTEVKAQVDQLKGQFPTPDAFANALKAQGMTEADLLAEARKSFLIQKYIDAKIIPQVKVADAAAKTFYDQNQDKMKRPERSHLRHILIKTDPKATAAEKKAAHDKAESLLAKAKAGEDFSKLARENSDDPGSKEKGGDLSWVTPGQTVPNFDKAAFALKKPNDYAPVVETQFGYHVIQMLEHQEPGVIPFDEVKDKIVNYLKQQQTRDLVQAKVKELRTKGKVETFI